MSYDRKYHYYHPDQGKLVKRSLSRFISAALWADSSKLATAYRAESPGRRIAILSQSPMAWPGHNCPGQASSVLASSMNWCPYPEIRTDGGLALFNRTSSIVEGPAFERRSSFADRGPLSYTVSRGTGR
ncbi:MAG: hypothetical protein JRN19_04215 [Nitrososphaerota archaeon]|nr:hypothetical protein [Nitrososphaerota archaeon]MDG7049446.1 hypothetical protein [Nitrososphaerota archaeon]MDG7051637.1 hypothetical protein [Nitrososphaerota archaeon]